MIGNVLAWIAFATTGKNIYQQIQGWPQPVFAVFALIAVGTLVPILRLVLLHRVSPHSCLNAQLRACGLYNTSYGDLQSFVYVSGVTRGRTLGLSKQMLRLFWAVLP